MKLFPFILAILICLAFKTEPAMAQVETPDSNARVIFGEDTIHPDSIGAFLLKKRSDPALQDSSGVIPDSILEMIRESKTEEKKFRRGRTEFSPRQAWVRSMIIPGWGQVYNRRLWKVPIVYAGFGGIAFGIIYQNKYYQQYREDYKCSVDTSCTEWGAGDQQVLLNARDFYRRNRDLFAIGAGLWYALQMLDAYVDAHMRGFNVSDDLSLHWDPDFMLIPDQRRIFLGMNLTLTIR